MAPIRYSREYWEGRAEEARAIAGQMSYRHTKRTMLNVAKTYEQLARGSEAQANLPAEISEWNKLMKKASS